MMFEDSQTQAARDAAARSSALDADFAREFIHATATVNGVRLHYVSGGDGPVVVLLHGFTETWFGFRHLLPLLTDAGYSVIAPDLRGLGDSERPLAGYDKRTLAEDVRALAHQLGHKRVLLVGTDEGGQVAYAWAARYPAEVERLVFFEAGLPGISKQEQVPWHDAFQSVADLPEALVAGRERVYLEWFYRNLTHDPASIAREAVDEYVRTYSKPGAMRAGFSLYRAKPQNVLDVRELAKRKLPMPVLALGGASASGSVPLDTMRAVAMNARGGIVPRAGHYLAEERPAFLAEQILAFFKESAK
jgi:pimeloyl-ACP methyl ester carboxylesterase